METKIVLPSTQKGYISAYFWAILWLVGLWNLASWAGDYRENTSSYWPQVLMWLTYIVMAIIALCTIDSAVYIAKTINTFYWNDKGFRGKLSRDSCGFPFSKSNEQVFFNRITHINVDQGSICRILNTGTLRIKMDTHTNTNFEKEEWIIYAIKNPYDQKAKIEEAILHHRGLIKTH